MLSHNLQVRTSSCGLSLNFHTGECIELGSPESRPVGDRLAISSFRALQRCSAQGTFFSETSAFPHSAFRRRQTETSSETDSIDSGQEAESEDDEEGEEPAELVSWAD